MTPNAWTQAAHLLTTALALGFLSTACGDREEDSADTGDGDPVLDTDMEPDTDTEPACNFDSVEGIAGRVVWREGDWMPGSGGGSERPLQTTVAAFPVLTEADVTPDASDPEAYGRFDVGSAVPVSAEVSDADGCFTLPLPTGSYTLMAEDGGAWFCNAFSSDGLCVVDASGGTVRSDITIDYRASY